MAHSMDAPQPGDPPVRHAREVMTTTAEGKPTGYTEYIKAVDKQTDNLDFARMRSNESRMGQEGRKEERFVSLLQESVLSPAAVAGSQEQGQRSIYETLRMLNPSDTQLQRFRDALRQEEGFAEMAGADDYELRETMRNTGEMMVAIAHDITRAGIGSFGPGLENSPNAREVKRGYALVRSATEQIAGVVLAARVAMPPQGNGNYTESVSRAMGDIAMFGKLSESYLSMPDRLLTHNLEEAADIQTDGERVGISTAALTRVEGIVAGLLSQDRPAVSERDRLELAQNIRRNFLQGDQTVIRGLVDPRMLPLEGSEFAKNWRQVVTKKMREDIQEATEGKKAAVELSDDPLVAQQDAIRASVTALTEANQAADGRIAEGEAKIADLQKQIEAEQAKIGEETVTKGVRAEVMGELQGHATQLEQQAAQRSEAEAARRTLGEAADDPNRQAVLRMDADALVGLYDGDTDVLLSALEDPAGLVTQVMELYDVPVEQQSDILKAFLRVRNVAQDVKDDPDVKEEERETFARRMKSLVERIGEDKVEAGRQKVTEMVQKAKVGETVTEDDGALQALLDKAKQLVSSADTGDKYAADKFTLH